MSNGTISHEAFKQIDSVDVKLDILFDTIQKNHDEQMQKCLCRADKCTGMFSEFEKRVKGLEKRKRFDTGVGGIAGFAGGFVAVVLKTLFFREL